MGLSHKVGHTEAPSFYRKKHKSGIFPALKKRIHILLILPAPLSHRHEETHSLRGVASVLDDGWTPIFLEDQIHPHATHFIIY